MNFTLRIIYSSLFLIVVSCTNQKESIKQEESSAQRTDAISELRAAIVDIQKSHGKLLDPMFIIFIFEDRFVPDKFPERALEDPEIFYLATYGMVLVNVRGGSALVRYHGDNRRVMFSNSDYWMSSAEYASLIKLITNNDVLYFHNAFLTDFTLHSVKNISDENELKAAVANFSNPVMSFHEWWKTTHKATACPVTQKATIQPIINGGIHE